MNRLTARLLLAFALVLIITLAFSTFALLVVLRARPVNLDTQYNELAATALDINYSDVLRGVFQIRQRTDFDNLSEARVLEALALYLTENAADQDTRLLIVRNQRQVLFDTNRAEPYTLTSHIAREPFLETTRSQRVGNLLSKGTFEADRQTWYFVEQPLLPEGNVVGAALNGPRRNENLEGLRRLYQQFQGVTIIVARPVPEQTFGAVIESTAGSGLFMAIFQAGGIGMIFAFLVSVWLVRWISRPLLNIAAGAAQVAEGNYTARVRVEGPQETKLVAQSFNHMASRVAATQQAQRDFLANVSHDLRTPLTSIQGFAQAIAEGVGDSQLATVIYDEASRLHRMVEDLLDLARIQAGRLDMLRQSVELDTLLRTVGHSLSVKAQQRGVTLHTDVPALPRIAGDGDRLAQVFTNLVDNAIKHTPEGGDVRVWAELDRRQHGVLIHIEDTGEGIPSQDLPRIFERFYQVDKSRAKASGTGLGLAITQEIITAHNGHIEVESEVGQGSCFSVWLPQPVGDMGQTVVATRLSQPATG